jgi:DAK2 domain fusion protein YloV
MEILDVPTFRGMLNAGELALERNVEAVNKLNVFPVPDGDTGTNMLLTLRSVGEAIKNAEDVSLSGTVSAGARGALLGARGNSGVILSQFFRGLADSLSRDGAVNADRFAAAFEEGASAAYRAVSNPTEGTLLTVLRRTAQEMRAFVDLCQGDISSLLQCGVNACRMAVSDTIEQLPILKQAGVVDAGGEGFLLILEGASAYLVGDDPSNVEVGTDVGSVSVNSFLDATMEIEYGYCTELLISGTDLDPDAIRIEIEALADSTVVIGDRELVKVHSHTIDPGKIVSFGVSIGTLSQVKIENMDDQHQEFQTTHRKGKVAIALAVVTVGRGQGINQIFMGLGAHRVVQGGQTMNPSCEDLLSSIELTGAQQALILPNNSNVIAAAVQAKALSEIPIEVVPTRTIPEGIAALLAYDATSDIEENSRAMAEAFQGIRSAEVVTAVRSARMDGHMIRAGDVIGSFEGHVVAVGLDCSDVLQGLLEHFRPSEGSLITLYWGGDMTEARVEHDVQRLRSQFSNVDFDVVWGGQPYYHYLVSVE